MELLDYYDENNIQKLGVAERDVIHDKELWHREVAIWIINEKSELLMQRRSPNKKQGANRISVTAGHVDAGELEIDAALREVKEEVGLSISKEELCLIGVYKYAQEHNFVYSYIYLIRTNKKLEEFIMQEEEVSELMYVPLEEIKTKIVEKDYTYSIVKKPYTKLILEKLSKIL